VDLNPSDWQVLGQIHHLLGTMKECGDKIVHCEAAKAATKHMTQDTHLKIFHKTGSRTNKIQPTVGCDHPYTVLNGRLLTISQTAGVRRELRDKFILARNG
jgi:hypothetical protein